MRVHRMALVWGLLALGVGGFVGLANLGHEAGPDAVVSPATASSGSGDDAALTPVNDERERELLPAPRAATVPSKEPSAAPARDEPPRKEKDFLAAFLAAERAEPGTLEHQAEALLRGSGPKAEKVALLRALERCNSAQHLTWLEWTAGSLPDDGDAHGVSVARYALERLVAETENDSAGLPAVRRLAFETPGVALDLRRSAALCLARNADEAGLGELRVALAREVDPVIVAGVVEALRWRSDSAQAVRLVAEYAGAAPAPAGN